MACDIQDPLPFATRILTTLQTLLGEIRLANGYHQDVSKVEIAARDWGDPELGLTATGDPQTAWIGIVPYGRRVAEYPGRLEYDWRINIITHAIHDGTQQCVLNATHALQYDIRDVIYDDPALGLPGVIRTRITDTEASEPHPQAAIEGIASTRTGISILYEKAL